MSKQIVHYKPSPNDVIRLGQSALVYPLDHTSELVTNTRVAYTSMVLKHNPNSGVFETMNSIYKPKE